VRCVRVRGPLTTASLVATALLASGPLFAQEVTPPRLLSQPAPAWPEGEPPREGVVVVDVLVDVDEEGTVVDVVVDQGVSARIDAAAVAAVRALRFAPAKRGQTPVASRVRLRIRFSPPTPDRAPIAVLRGSVVERTSGRPVAGARVSSGHVSRVTDAAGLFEMELAPGRVDIALSAPGYRTMGATETLGADDALRVRYAMTSQTAETYETVVTAGERQEISRTVLRREEVRMTPGTMGDPFRVLETLPGVVPLLTGVPYYYIRGAPPADTGYFIDGVEVPALFHLALGPSVIHPNLVDRIDFFAGGAPARYPGFVGGVVGATSAPIPDDRVHLDLDLRLIDAGGIVSTPLDDATRVSLSGRYSYTAALLSAFSPETVVDYWDYQGRVSHDLSPDRTVSIFAFGSYDLIGERDGTGVTPNFVSAFHRVVGTEKWQLGSGRSLEAGVFVGFNEILLGEGTYARDYVTGPRAVYETTLAPDLGLTVGADATYSYSDFAIDGDEGGFGYLLTSQHIEEAGAFGELQFQADEGTTLLPGVRALGIVSGDVVRGAVDPRFGFRRRLAQPVTLKGSVGLYHQRPAFVIPLPGLDAIDLRRGLQRSVQASQGVEWESGLGLSVDAQVFFHRYENLSDIDIEAEGFPRLAGNAYGLEVIVRRPLTERLFGWVAYTLSRSERHFPARCDDEEGEGCTASDFEYVAAQTAPSDFDRTHVANLVLSYGLPSGLRAGGRLQYRSGRPYTPQVWTRPFGYARGFALEGPRNSARMPGYTQLDLRVDKRWRYRSWDLELYFEFINVTFSYDVLDVSQECEEDGCTVRYTDQVPIVIPTLGARGVF